MCTSLCIPALVVTVIVLPPAADSAGRPAPGQDRGPRAAQRALVEGNNAFALDLYARLARGGGNLFFSPFSVGTAMAMAAAGARGQTADEIEKVLHLALPLSRAHPAFEELLETVARPAKQSAGEPYRLVVATALWGQKGIPFRKEFLEVVNERYGGALSEVDFEEARESAVAEINSWVEKATEQRIPRLLSAGDLGDNLRLVLATATHFRSSWARGFEPRHTKELRFHLPKQSTVNRPLMSVEQYCAYVEGDGFQAVKLFYEGRALSMVVVVPRQVEGLADIERRLTLESLSGWLQAMRVRLVDLTMPRFNLDSRLDLKETLGMPLAFSSQADFSGIADMNPISLSHVIQRASVKVDENGTEATAATSVGVDLGGGDSTEPVRVRADRPFLFLIHHTETGLLLFLGRVMDPMGR